MTCLACHLPGRHFSHSPTKTNFSKVDEQFYLLIVCRSVLTDTFHLNIRTRRHTHHLNTACGAKAFAEKLFCFLSPATYAGHALPQDDSVVGNSVPVTYKRKNSCSVLLVRFSSTIRLIICLGWLETGKRLFCWAGFAYYTSLSLHHRAFYPCTPSNPHALLVLLHARTALPLH